MVNYPKVILIKNYCVNKTKEYLTSNAYAKLISANTMRKKNRNAYRSFTFSRIRRRGHALKSIISI